MIFEQQIRPFLLLVIFSNYSYLAENFLPNTEYPRIAKNGRIVRITNTESNIRHIPDNQTIFFFFHIFNDYA